MKLHRSEIPIRDPYLLTVNDTYYMYGSIPGYDRFLCYRSENLEWFDQPIELFCAGDGFWADRDFWAPEVHFYKDKYYMFASFKSPDRCRGSQILCADRPEGPFVPLTEKPFTPADWECLDATLFVENGKPYTFFCHEWLQIQDGRICVAQLSDDLTSLVSEPQDIAVASEAPWTTPMLGYEQECYVTDGPFIHRMQDGSLIMLWSSFSNGDYAIGQLRSQNGVFGPWEHIPEPLFHKDGGHGMLFYTQDGRLTLSIHQPNGPFGVAERAVFFPLEEKDGKLALCNE